MQPGLPAPGLSLPDEGLPHGPGDALMLGQGGKQQGALLCQQNHPTLPVGRWSLTGPTGPGSRTEACSAGALQASSARAWLG